MSTKRRRPVAPLALALLVSSLQINLPAHELPGTTLVTAAVLGLSTAKENEDNAVKQKVVQKGLDYLSKSGQASDGTFSIQAGPGVTALVLTAMLRHQVDLAHPSLAKGLKALEGFVKPDGGIYGNGRLKNYETCVGILAFSEANKRAGDGSEAARLTKSGTIAALGVLEGKSDSQILTDLEQQSNASQIINDVRELIGQLGLPNKRYPIFNLSDPLAGDNPAGLNAPFQADVELPEGLDDLKVRLRALWQAGIPHVRFVEAPSKSKIDHPLSEEQLKTLCGAVQFAEDIGMIAGVRLSASSLMQRTANGKPLVDRIAELGVDYVVAPWAVEPELHQSIFGSNDQAQFQPLVVRANHWEFPVVLEAGLVLESVNCFEEQLDLAIAQGITHFEVFPIVRTQGSNEKTSPQAYQPQHLKQLAGWIEDLADNRRAQIVWLPPHTTASPLNQNRIRQLMKSGPRAGADVSIRVDASGQVFAPRGARTAVGKIQQSSWDQIWEHSCFQRFRELVCRNDHCNNCPMLTMCASHCPADQAGWTIEE